MSDQPGVGDTRKLLHAFVPQNNESQDYCICGCVYFDPIHQTAVKLAAGDTLQATPEPFDPEQRIRFARAERDEAFRVRNSAIAALAEERAKVAVLQVDVTREAVEGSAYRMRAEIAEAQRDDAIKSWDRENEARHDAEAERDTLRARFADVTKSWDRDACGRLDAEAALAALQARLEAQTSALRALHDELVGLLRHGIHVEKRGVLVVADKLTALLATERTTDAQEPKHE